MFVKAYVLNSRLIISGLRGGVDYKQPRGAGLYFDQGDGTLYNWSENIYDEPSFSRPLAAHLAKIQEALPADLRQWTPRSSLIESQLGR